MFKPHVLCAMICVLSLSVACSKKQDPPKPTPKPTSNNESQKPKPKPKAEDKPEVKEPQIKMATKRKRPKTKKEVLKAFYGHLQAGQKAVRAKKYDDGIAEYQKALKLDAKSPTALGEMGWAYFKKKELEKAESFTAQALEVSTKKNQLGMFLYNMGRISEERGNKPRALRYYRDSLAKRDNKVVKGRVTKLEGQNVAVEVVKCPFKVHPKPTAKLDNLCKISKSYDEDECLLDHKFKGTWKTVGPKTKVLLMSGDQTGFERSHYVMVQHDGKTYYALVAQGSRGVEGGEEWTIKKVEFKQIVPGGLPELVIYGESEISERGEPTNEDDGPLYDWSTEYIKDVTVVSFDKPTPAFALRVTGNVTAVAQKDGKVAVTYDNKGKTSTKVNALKDLNRCPYTY